MQLSNQAQDLLTKFYLKQGNSYEDQLYKIATMFCGDNMVLRDKLYDYSVKGYFGYASPIVTCPNGTGLPISCFLMYVPDTIIGIIGHSVEMRWLSVMGGGCGGHWSDLRTNSDKSCGPIPFIHTVDADVTAYRQGSTRKGSYAAYMDISHPDIVEFILMRTPTGDIHRKNLNLHHGVNVTDKFMKAVEEGKIWQLIDPHTKVVKETIAARELWQLMLETRFRTGEPYLNFIDTANRALPLSMKEKGLTIKGSNLCNEIHLPTDQDRTGVCCLSSLNLEKYDEWKNTDVVECCIEMLDNVLEYFITNAPPQLAKAVYSATQERSLGLGAMGWAYYLQKNNIPFESDIALQLTEEIFSSIKAKATMTSRRMAFMRGEAPDMDGTGMRNAHLLAVAPNANTSCIADTSPSIEPIVSNGYVHRTRAGSHLIINKYLKIRLNEIGMDTEQVWESIISNNGSIQHLDLSESIKSIFKTAAELDQTVVIKQAAIRQKYICQGQSLNLFFPKGSEKSYLTATHYLAWKLGCKGLYYLRTSATKSVQSVFKMAKPEQDECISCQG